MRRRAKRPEKTKPGGARTALVYHKSGRVLPLFQIVDLQTDRICTAELDGVDHTGHAAIVERSRGLYKDRSFDNVPGGPVRVAGKRLGNIAVGDALAKDLAEPLYEICRVAGRSHIGLVV